MRYYVSNRLISGGVDPSGWRLPGPALETSVRDIIAAHLKNAATSHRVLNTPDAGSADAMTRAVRDLIARLKSDGGAPCSDLLSGGILQRGEIALELDGKFLARALGAPEEDLHPALSHIRAPFDLRRRGVETKIVAGDIAPDPDPHLRGMLIRAHGWTFPRGGAVSTQTGSRRFGQRRKPGQPS